MTRHYETELQEALDGRLDANGQAELDEHLADCASCRAAHDQLRWVKDAIARVGKDEAGEAPPQLESRIRAALDEEDRVANTPLLRPDPHGLARVQRWPLAYRLLAAAAALIVVVGAGLLGLRRAGTADIAADVVRDFDRYRSGALTLVMATSDAAGLEASLAARNVGFPARVLDLQMMGYQLVGGGPHVLAGRQAVLFVYRDALGRVVLCEMYPGKVDEVARGSDAREHEGTTFHVRRLGDRTVVFWQEGEVVCALASDGDPEVTIQLAFAKAMKAA